jgi:hypothetical protein
MKSDGTGPVTKFDSLIWSRRLELCSVGKGTTTHSQLPVKPSVWPKPDSARSYLTKTYVEILA